MSCYFSERRTGIQIELSPAADGLRLGGFAEGRLVLRMDMPRYCERYAENRGCL
jgi:hypothetical protein